MSGNKEIRLLSPYEVKDYQFIKNITVVGGPPPLGKEAEDLFNLYERGYTELGITLRPVFDEKPTENTIIVLIYRDKWIQAQLCALYGKPREE